jgi:hypothetical protein
LAETRPWPNNNSPRRIDASIKPRPRS